MSLSSIERRRKYYRERKKKFKEKGICVNCLKRQANPGNVCCLECLENKRFNTIFGKYIFPSGLFEETKKKQNGLCAICEKQKLKLVIDHCHTKMVFRGLLCYNCNMGLGQFFDNVEVLKKAIVYLENTR